MPLIDIRCAQDHTHEVSRPVADWPATPPCPTCGAATTQVHLPPRTRWAIDPVVVYRAPDGTYRFPGETTTLSTAKYDRAGYERIELRSVADVRRFEAHMNAIEHSRSSRRAEVLQAAREQREAATRRELRAQLPHFSRPMRDLARAIMARNDGKPRERGREAGFHVEVFSYDHSNRAESRDPHGRRRRD